MPTLTPRRAAPAAGRRKGAAPDERVDGERQRHPCPGDRRRAGAAVGLDDVAVELDHLLAEGVEVDDGAQAAADEPLDLVGAAADAPAL
jgi:hypothetical protein